MKKISFHIFKILNVIIFKMKNPNIKISLISNIHPLFLKKNKEKTKDVVLGNSTISKDVIIEEGTKFLNKVYCIGNINIGRYTSINGPNTFILSNINSISIGSFCSIAPGVRIQEYFHDYRRATSYYINTHILKESTDKDIFSKGDILIEDDVWIGANVVIMSGVKIGRGSIVGAGSIVTKDIPPYCIVGGNPAKIIKKRFTEETINELEISGWWTWSIEKIKDNQEFFNKRLI